MATQQNPGLLTQTHTPLSQETIVYLGEKVITKLEGIRKETRETGTKNRMEARAGSLAESMRKYSGESNRRLCAWFKDMELVALQVGADAERMKQLALHTLSGDAKTFIGHYLGEHPTPTWDEIKTAMRDRFSDSADVRQAQQELKKIRQKKGENVRNFSERLRTAAEDAYPGKDLADPIIEGRLLEIYTDGLREDRLVRKIIRAKPTTLAGATRLAKEEQQDSRTFELMKRLDEPMEVDVVAQRRLDLEQRTDMLTQQVAELLEITKRGMAARPNPGSNQANYRPRHGDNQRYGESQDKGYQFQSAAQSPSQPRYPSQVPSQYQWTQDGRPVCARCNRVGHTQRKCRAQNQGN